jgi:4-hydroxy-tetrahydrodipicolinate synthase
LSDPTRDDRPSLGNAVVPLRQDGEVIDTKGFRRMLRYMADGGTGVFVGGPHATEFVSMDRRERRRLWKLAVDELAGVAPINAIPLGPASTTELIAMFARAKAMGFDGAQLYPAAEGGQRSDGLFIAEAERYFRDVLDAVDLPMYLCGYHGGEIIDSPTQQVPLELHASLVHEYPHIVGVTIDGSRIDDATLRAFVAAVEGRVPVRLAGALDWFAKMQLGVYGFHSIQQSVAPRLCSSMMAAFHSGDLVRAKELSVVIRLLNDVMHDPRYHYPRSLKPVLNRLGFDMGIIRRPYLPLPADLQAELTARIDELDLGRYETLP